MNRRLGTWLSFAACVHALGVTTPVFAQPKAGTPPPSADAPSTKKTAGTPAKSGVRDLIDKGHDQFDDQRYEESIQTLSGALVTPGNTKEEKIEILRLLALDYITLDRKEEAEGAVRGLLVVQPNYQLPDSESPRFRDFFAHVRSKWVAEGRPGLVTETTPKRPAIIKHQTPEEAEAGHTLELRARVEDPDKQATRVDLYYRAGSKGSFTKIGTRFSKGAVQVQVPGSSVKPPLIDYYFEAVDDSGALVATKGDSSAPLRVAVPEEKGGWVLPVAIGGGILGAAAIVGGLALAGVFKGSSPTPNPGPGTSTVSVSIGEAR